MVDFAKVFPIVSIVVISFFCLAGAARWQEEVLPRHPVENIDGFAEASLRFELAQEYEKRRERFRRDIFVIKILRASLHQPQILDSLDLSDEQSGKIEKIVSVYKEKEIELRERYADSEDIEKLVSKKMMVVNSDLTSEVCNILRDEQLEDLVQMNVLSTGMPKLLLNSKMGDIIVLSETQRSKIKASSDRIARKVEKFVDEIRRESADAVMLELDQSQKQSLRDIYGAKIIQNYFESLDVNFIFAHFRFETRDSVGQKHRPNLWRTKLEGLWQ